MMEIKLLVIWGVVLLGLVIGFLVARHKLLYHFRTIDPGHVYASGTLSWPVLGWVCRRFGIRTIVNLRYDSSEEREWYRRQKLFCAQRNILMVDFPMTTIDPPSDDQIKGFAELADDAERHPLLIHCEHGVIRTNMMVAIYLKRRFDMPNTEILDRLLFYGHNVHKKIRRRVLEFILTYDPRSAGDRCDPGPAVP